jgi:NitT/TauT family transport system permease protein
MPTSLPYLFAAARICVGLALVGAVIGELYGGSTAGLGYQINTAQRRTLIDQLWGSIFVLASIGVIAVLGLMALERWVLRWHTSDLLHGP